MSVALNRDVVSYIFSYLDVFDLARVERVSKSCKELIEKSNLWKRHCQEALNIPPHLDPKDFISEPFVSYKLSMLTAVPRVFGVTSGIALERASQPDPLEPTKTIGQNYIWFYVSNEMNSITKASMNFEIPYFYVENNLWHQYKNVEVQEGWVCMREKLIGFGSPVSEQLDAAKTAGVSVAPLVHRVIFNMLKSLSDPKGGFPDSRTPSVYARTSLQNHPNYVLCGSDLCISEDFVNNTHIGLAVELSTEVRGEK